MPLSTLGVKATSMDASDDIIEECEIYKFHRFFLIVRAIHMKQSVSLTEIGIIFTKNLA